MTGCWVPGAKVLGAVQGAGCGVHAAHDASQRARRTGLRTLNGAPYSASRTLHGAPHPAPRTLHRTKHPAPSTRHA